MDFSFSEKNEKEESEDSVQVCILVGFDRATQFIRLKKKTKKQKPIARQKLNHVHLRRSAMFLLTLRHVDNQDKMIYEPFGCI